MLCKIAHVITGLQNGGAEAMLLKLLTETDKKQFCPLVISLTNRGVMAEKFEILGVRVLTCDMLPSRPSISGVASLLKYLRYFRPDLVQTWLYHADLLGGIAARVLRIRCVVWNVRHDNLDRDKNKSHTLWAVRANALLSSWVPSKIVCNSANSAIIHQSIGFKSQPFVIIPNGFDIDIFRPDSRSREKTLRELNIPSDSSLVGLIARFHPQKNHERFIRAAAQVIKANSRVYFLLAGADVDWNNAALVSWIDEHGLRDRFRLLGRRDDIPSLLASLDVAVCASWGEGFPNVVGEAMACEIPCVVTDVGDCANIVGDTGWVVKSGDFHALGDSIVSALMTPRVERMSMGKRARKRIIEHYALPAIVSQYERLYTSLVREQH